MQLKISTAPRRTSTKWLNSTIDWAELCERLAQTHRTPETLAQFLKMTHAEQSDVKDVGGFVAGHLAEGRRKKGSVLCRSALALDIDFGTPDVWLTLAEELTCAACVYTTHKHTPEAPRLRIVVPLAREVSAEEYVPVARGFASRIGMDYFDDSTYEPHRLMYWPSTPVDGEYECLTFEGEPLDPDVILDGYTNWQDASTWPMSTRQVSVVASTASKQEDPREKSGIVGAFCKAYTIQEAIEAFIPAYEAISEDRYTYTPGEATGGLVVYENGLFAYSHHGSDPAGQQLCNAFDLVRLHKFGELDRDAQGASGGKAPSYKEMTAWAADLPEVRSQLLLAAVDEFETVTGESGEWMAGLDLETDKAGKLRPTLPNLVTLLRADPNLKGIAYDELWCSIAVKDILPWARPALPWRDVDDANLAAYVEERFARFAERDLKNALAIVADERKFHPVRDYLKTLPTWDGIERVDTLLVDYLGAEDDEYTRAVTRKLLCAAVRRAKRPGVKFDTMLVLAGPQGIGKSTLIARLGGDWFNDSLSLADTRDKTAAEKLQGFWIHEFGELAGLRKADTESLRSFLSRQDDIYRGAYERRVSRHPRQCVFFGTTNAEDGFLTDPAGNRRMWPVDVTGDCIAKPWDLTDRDVAQIWSEAVTLERAGEPLHLTGAVARMAKDRQRDAIEVDERVGMIAEFLDRQITSDWAKLSASERRNWFMGIAPDSEPRELVQRDSVSVIEIWCECLDKRQADLSRRDSYWIGNALRKLGWEAGKNPLHRGPYGRQRAFIRLPEASKKDVF